MKALRRPSSLRKILSVLLILAFGTSFIFPPSLQAQNILGLPQPGTMVAPSPAFVPPVLKGIQIFPDNPLRFDFFIDNGDAALPDEALKEESSRLIKYFLAALTVPGEELWVNLSPYEKDRIIPPEFGVTEMGRDLLAQDYILKQLTASLVYPEDELGKKFWDKVHAQAYQLRGDHDAALDTFNKVWIVPESAAVYVNGEVAFVAESHLKVMMEEDYLVRSSELVVHGSKELSTMNNELRTLLKESIIPEIEKEVNEGKNFTRLRQIYHAVILATWFKQNLRQNILNKIYVDQHKVDGVDVDDKEVKQKIYEQYLEAYKKGVYNYIKEEYDPSAQEVIQRKYFSGGTNFNLEGTVAVKSDPGSVQFSRGGVTRAQTVFNPSMLGRDVMIESKVVPKNTSEGRSRDVIALVRDPEFRQLVGLDLRDGDRVVDFGVGDPPVTTRQLAENLRETRPNLEVMGVELPQAAAQAHIILDGPDFLRTYGRIVRGLLGRMSAPIADRLTQVRLVVSRNGIPEHANISEIIFSYRPTPTAPVEHVTMAVAPNVVLSRLGREDNQEVSRNDRLFEWTINQFFGKENLLRMQQEASESGDRAFAFDPANRQIAPAAISSVTGLLVRGNPIERDLASSDVRLVLTDNLIQSGVADVSLITANNVVMHMDPEQKARQKQIIAQALREGGVLITKSNRGFVFEDEIVMLNVIDVFKKEAGELVYLGTRMSNSEGQPINEMTFNYYLFQIEDDGFRSGPPVYLNGYAASNPAMLGQATGSRRASLKPGLKRIVSDVNLAETLLRTPDADVIYRDMSDFHYQGAIGSVLEADLADLYTGLRLGDEIISPNMARFIRTWERLQDELGALGAKNIRIVEDDPEAHSIEVIFEWKGKPRRVIYLYESALEAAINALSFDYILGPGAEITLKMILNLQKREMFNSRIRTVRFDLPHSSLVETIRTYSIAPRPPQARSNEDLIRLGERIKDTYQHVRHEVGNFFLPLFSRADTLQSEMGSGSSVHLSAAVTRAKKAYMEFFERLQKGNITNEEAGRSFVAVKSEIGYQFALISSALNLLRVTSPGLAESVDSVQEIMREVEEYMERVQDDTLVKENIDLTKLISSATHNVPMLIDGGSHRLQMPDSRFIITVDADQLRMHEVLVNLMKNAVEAMAAGGTLTVTTELSENRETVAVKIADTGSGMSQDQLANLFQKFYTTKGVKGTGLGLYLSRQIIEAHGGSISVMSEQGVGTTFTINLPVAKAEERKIVVRPQPDQVEAKDVHYERPKTLGAKYGSLSIKGIEWKVLGGGGIKDVFYNEEALPGFVVSVMHASKSVHIYDAPMIRLIRILGLTGIAPRLLSYGFSDSNAESGHFYVQAERIYGKDLLSLTPLSDEQADQMTALLDRMIRNKVIVRDFKPENFVLGHKLKETEAQDKMYLVDFDEVDLAQSADKAAQHFLDHYKDRLSKGWGWERVDPKGRIGEFLEKTLSGSGQETAPANAAMLGQDLVLKQNSALDWSLFYQGRELPRLGQRPGGGYYGANNMTFDNQRTVVRVKRWKDRPYTQEKVDLLMRMGRLQVSPEVFSHGVTSDGFPFIEISKIQGANFDQALTTKRPLAEEEINGLKELFSRLVEHNILSTQLSLDNIIYGHKYRGRTKAAYIVDIDTLRDSVFPRSELIDFYLNAYAHYGWEKFDPQGILEEHLQSLRTSSNPAMLSKENVGGIDLGPENINLQTRGEAIGIPLPDVQELENLKIDGLYPIILNVAPVTNLPLLLGVAEEKSPQKQLSSL